MADTVLHLKIDEDVKNAFDAKAREDFNMKSTDLHRLIIEALTEDRLQIIPNETQKNLHNKLFKGE